MRIVGSILLISLGVFAIIFGEADDSPGLQGIGLIIIVSNLWLAYRNRSRR
jgi:hypothetical protein